MKCPVCGVENEDFEYTSVTVELDPEKLAEFVYAELISRGYAPRYDDINMILDIIDDYMFIQGVFGDNAEGS